MSMSMSFYEQFLFTESVRMCSLREFNMTLFDSNSPDFSLLSLWREAEYYWNILFKSCIAGTTGTSCSKAG